MYRFSNSEKKRISKSLPKYSKVTIELEKIVLQAFSCKFACHAIVLTKAGG